MFVTFSVQRLVRCTPANAISNGFDLNIRVSGAYHKKVGKTGNAPDINYQDAISLLIQG